VRNLQEHVAGDQIDPPRREYEPPRRTTTSESPRVPFEDAFEVASSFDDLTRQAVEMAERVDEPYAGLLKLLADCHEVAENAGGLPPAAPGSDLEERRNRCLQGGDE